jgi:hypothetical protein
MSRLSCCDDLVHIATMTWAVLYGNFAWAVGTAVRVLAHEYDKPFAILNALGGPHPMRTFLAIITAVFLSLPLLGATQQSPTTDDIVQVANAFLASLSVEQRQNVLYVFNDAAQRARWSNFPTGFVPRGGISLKQMSLPQRDAAMKLLATVLSTDTR